MEKTSTKNWLKFVFMMAMVGISTATFTNSAGPSGGLTGAPSEGNCTSCHSGSAITSGTAHSSITLSGIPAGGYAPGTTYTLTLSGASAATAKNGFQITALNASNTMAGSFTAGTGSQTIVSGTRLYAGHSSSGTSLSSWTFSWTAPSVAAGNITFYIALNATNSSNSESGDAIYLKSFTYAPGNLPVPTIVSPANAAAFCLGDTIQFQASATNNPTGFNWTFLGNVPSSSTLQNPKIVFANPGFVSVRLTATNASGTSTFTTISVQVVAKPTATITPSASQVICGNDSITLSANSGIGLTYLWTPGNMTTKDVKIGSAGSYTVKVTNSTGCFKTSNAVLTSVVTKPTITIQTNADTICSKDSLLISAGAGFSLYRYFVDGVQVDSSASASRKIKLAAGSFDIGVKGFNGTCNSDLTSKKVLVQAQDPAPSLSCGTTTPSSITFNVGGINTQISIDGGQNWVTPNAGSSHILNGLTPNQSILAWARTNSNTICQYSIVATKTCVASNCQPITMQLSYPKNMCNPGSPNYKLKVLSTNAVNPYYKLSNPPSLPIGFSKMDSFNLGSFTGSNFTISIIDSANAGCGIKDSLLVIPTISIVDPSVVAISDLTVCGNATFTFDVKTNGSSALVDYVKMLSSNGTELERKTVSQGLKFGPFPASQFAVNNQFSLVSTDTASGCSSSPAINSVNIKVPAQAKIQAFTENLKIELRDTTAASTNRSWSFGDGNTASNTSRNVTHTYAAAGSYKAIVTITDGNGCSNKDSVQLTIVATGLVQENGLVLFNVFPNPANNEITLNWNTNSTGNANLFDLNGKEVFQSEVQSGKSISIEGLSKGVYMLKLETGNEIGYRKLIIN